MSFLSAQQIVLASGNQGKIKEIQALLSEPAPRNSNALKKP